MFEPRETDIPALFVFLVVLPLVTYFLLGRWSEAAKKKERISLLAQLAAEQSVRSDAMVAASVIPLAPLSNNGIQKNIGIIQCARCYSPATTRCSQCKSVRYCSGKCQIIHWRQVHKQECQQLENSCFSSSLKSDTNEESIHKMAFLDKNKSSQCFGYDFKQPRHLTTRPDDIIHTSVSMTAPAIVACMDVDASGVPITERRSMNKRASGKSNRETLRREDGAILESSEQASRSGALCSSSSNVAPQTESYYRLKLRESDTTLSEEIPEKGNANVPDGFRNGLTNSIAMHGSNMFQSQNESIIDSRANFSISNSLSSPKYGKMSTHMEPEDDGSLLCRGIPTKDETTDLKCSSGRTSMKRSSKAKTASDSPGTKMYKSPKSTSKASRGQSCSDMERKGQIADDLISRTKETVPVQGSNGISSMGLMKMIGLVKSAKHDRQDPSAMLFPYEEFVKFFQYEVYELLPRGLINCGNSCYANAVLQCLTCTKPLTIYLLRRSHSRACCVNDWCLMCELEQHVMMLKENGGPLSPSRILLHMRRINCQIGNGSQEDAHEFLRLLVTSMQSICLEGLGGDTLVDSWLQETTFIQHTFGGRLGSKVKCFRCHHESERYENFMDLTLEIFGWVESLEDALTQFTFPEDLDGENMYRCGRCAKYVRAQKQLGIKEAPNILTIVLKRFQEGSYGKINKCITFPEMLDMVPFMTGTDDIPPLYMLYAVVVHLDTLNASFSGHYVSYVKDMQGNWFRIDDTQVQPVPMSQVMLEGAYILFYTRSCPRPAGAYTGKLTRHHASSSANHWTLKTKKPCQSNNGCSFVGPEPSSYHRPETDMGFTNHISRGILRSANRNILPVMETYAESTSSDWSLFTSSDEASFTTESTRDSFSTIDYVDACNTDPLSSIFNSLYATDYSSRKTVAHSKFSSSKSLTRFVSEGKGFVQTSYPSSQPHDRVQKGENLKQVSIPATKTLPCDIDKGVYVKHGSNPKDGPCRTSGRCKQ